MEKNNEINIKDKFLKNVCKICGTTCSIISHISYIYMDKDKNKI